MKRPLDAEILDALAAANQDMSDLDRLVNIYHLLSQVLSFEVPGAVVELGCNAGGTSVFLRMILDESPDPGRPLHVYDSFQGLPAPVAQDAYLHRGDCRASRKELEATFARWQRRMPHVHEGWFSDVLPTQLPSEIAFAYLDADFFESTYVALEHLYPRLAPNAILCIDDYADPQRNPRAWAGLPGVKAACDRFFEKLPERPTVLTARGDLAMAVFRKARPLSATASKASDGPLDHLPEVARRHVWPVLQPLSALREGDGVQVVTSGQGCWVTDADGRRWFDAMAGNCLVNVGYGRSEIAEAAASQMRQLCYAPQFTYSRPSIELAGRIAGLSPDPESRVFFVSGGSEAVETAIKLARKYHKITGRPGKYKVISRLGSYHGATLATAGLGGRPKVESDFGPLPNDAPVITQPFPRHCAHCQQQLSCTLACAQDAIAAIEAAGPDSVAALVAEPIAMAHMEVPPARYFAELQEICRAHDILLIVDEVITGFGRTGRMFGIEHFGVVPDIITVAKGLTAGYAPIGAAIVRRGIADAFDGDPDHAFRHLFTFGGNPVSAAAALATLDIIEREQLVANAATLGAYLFNRLRELPDGIAKIDVRGGLGLMCAVEVSLPDGGRGAMPSAEIGRRMTALLRARRLLVRQSDHVTHLLPPLCIQRREVDFIVDTVAGALRELAVTP